MCGGGAVEGEEGEYVFMCVYLYYHSCVRACVRVCVCACVCVRACVRACERARVCLRLTDLSDEVVRHTPHLLLVIKTSSKGACLKKKERGDKNERTFMSFQRRV